MNRRKFLAFGPVLLAAALPARQDTTAIVADPLMDPSITGRPRSIVTPADNLERVKLVERQLKCTCGCNLDIFTCRTTDFTCTVSPALHREVLDLFEAGKSPDEIVQAFVAKRGESILMAPPAQGFNLIGYLLPGLAVVVAGTVIGLVLFRKRSRPGVTDPSEPRRAAELVEPVEPTLEELERVRTGLEEIR
jgi:cytochrome c-type biogenesis protein CcmH